MIYCELVFIDNAIIDYFLLRGCTYLYPPECVSSKRMIISSLLGGIYAALLPIFDLLNLFPVKMIVGLAMIIQIYRSPKIKEIFWSYFIYVLLNCAAAGIILCINSWLGTDILSGTVVSQLPMAVIILMTCLVGRLCTHITAKVKERLFARSLNVTMIMSIDGCEKHIYGYLDSGNLLLDSVSGLPVVVVPDVLIGDCKYNEERKMAYKTASGEGMMYLLEPDWIKIVGSEKRAKAMLGIVRSELIGDIAIIPMGVM